MTILKGEKYKIQEIKNCPSEIRCTFYTSNTPLPKPHLNNANILQGMSWSVIAEIQKSTGEKAPHLIGLHREKSHQKRHLKSESSRIRNLWYMHAHTHSQKKARSFYRQKCYIYNYIHLFVFIYLICIWLYTNNIFIFMIYHPSPLKPIRRSLGLELDSNSPQ